MKSVRWIISYILVASLGLWLAFAVSMKFIGPAQSQEAPSNGDLPPEFMKEVESTQVPPADAKSAPEKNPVVPPPPTSATSPGGEAAEPAVPPPPVPAPVEAVQPPSSGGAPSEVSTFSLPKDGYTYDPIGKRDPFKAFKILRSSGSEKSTVEVEALEPLQRWEIDRLQVVGILWDVSKPRAMVRDPDGVVYTVTKNSKIGRNEGVVAVIREGELVVIETRFEEGNAVKEPRVLELKK